VRRTHRVASGLASAALGCTPLVSGAAAHPDGTAASAARDGSHDFDFDFGTWNTHSTRPMHPLSGARDWVDMDGITVVTGSGADGPTWPSIAPKERLEW